MTLQRFVSAQNGVFGNVVDELLAGKKRTHWMWFVFPQYARLDNTPKARFYALDRENEAREYLEHPILGPRLTYCTNLVLNAGDVSRVFGYPDDLKFETCMQIFGEISPAPIFKHAIELCESTISEESRKWG